MNSGIKPSWPDNVNKHRAASRGRVFTRREKVQIVENQRGAKKENSLIQEFRLEIQKEKAARAYRIAVMQAAMKNPEEKIYFKKDGQAYIQRRVKGKFQKPEVIK